jgi:hypothetical protein
MQKKRNDMQHTIKIKTKYGSIECIKPTKFEAMLYLKETQKDFDVVSYEIAPTKASILLERAMV